jgi:hypothetical protein
LLIILSARETNMKIILHLFLLVFVLVSASACNPATTTPTVVNEVSSAVTTAYPAPLTTSNAYPDPLTEGSAYPAPVISGGAYPAPLASGAAYPAPYPSINGASTNVLATPGAIPEPSPESSVITGRLTEQGKPVINATIYLADIRKDKTGEYQVAAFSRSSSPRAYTDADGQFVFTNIPPGEYSLILDNIATYIVLNVPDGAPDEALKLVAEAGKVVELGTLDYIDLPDF